MMIEAKAAQVAAHGITPGRLDPVAGPFVTAGWEAPPRWR